MPKLTVFNQVTLDGFFTDSKSDISWAHQAADPEWKEYVAGNVNPPVKLTLTNSRAFKNGNVVLTYERSA